MSSSQAGAGGGHGIRGEFDDDEEEEDEEDDDVLQEGEEPIIVLAAAQLRAMGEELLHAHHAHAQQEQAE